MIKLFHEGKTILNVDESWIAMSDFRRRKWQMPGTTNSVPKLLTADRISMITSLDNTGSVYLSLLQSNSNGKVMDIFLRQLALQLDRDRPDWRNDTVLLMDNAKYHWSKTTTKTLKSLSGPHSYAASPCELWFASFKCRDINPRRLSLAKG